MTYEMMKNELENIVREGASIDSPDSVLDGNRKVTMSTREDADFELRQHFNYWQNVVADQEMQISIGG